MTVLLRCGITEFVGLKLKQSSAFGLRLALCYLSLSLNLCGPGREIHCITRSWDRTVLS